jgi:cyclopropane fatty-acyl-phospholipid synthase-like methyltransferase
MVWDALRLGDIGEQFDTVIDSGLFHVFDDEQRRQYVDSLHAAVRAGGRYFLACFSDRQPGDWGPRRVSEKEILDAFEQGWKVNTIRPEEFDVNLDPPTAVAWLAKITRI